MAQKLSSFAALMLADAADIATGMGGGTTEAEVQAVARMLDALSTRNDLLQPAIQICYPADQRDILPG